MPASDGFRDAHLTISPSAVFRHFGDETVVLNLETGVYHGLNRTAGRMLELIRESGDAEQVVSTVAKEYGTPVETVRADLRVLCDDLLERKILRRESADGAR